MKTTIQASLVAALLIISAPLALAQEGPGNPCKADREKLCPGMKPGDGQFGACMKQHEAEFSDECKAFRQESQEARKNVRMNCKADSEKLCADAKGAMMKCLKDHTSELGQSCADALKALPGAKNS